MIKKVKEYSATKDAEYIQELLVGHKRFASAGRHAESRANLAEASEVMGRILDSRGSYERAVGQYKEAVKEYSVAIVKAIEEEKPVLFIRGLKRGRERSKLSQMRSLNLAAKQTLKEVEQTNLPKLLILTILSMGLLFVPRMIGLTGNVVGSSFETTDFIGILIFFIVIVLSLLYVYRLRRSWKLK